MQDPPQTELVRIALDRTNGVEFEEFALSFLSAKLGATFVPQGGVRDGGADGFIDDNIFGNVRRPSSFMQASIDKEPLAKIRRTVRRLREIERDPDEVLYFTNQIVSRLDLEQEKLAAELGLSVRILDANYIIVQVPTDPGSVNAYYEHLHHQTGVWRVGGGLVMGDGR